MNEFIHKLFVRAFGIHENPINLEKRPYSPHAPEWV